MGYVEWYFFELILYVLAGVALAYFALKKKQPLLAAASAVFVAIFLHLTEPQRRMAASNSGNLVPVGSGWSFFLNKKGVPGVPVNAPSGLQSSGRWGAGTLIKDLQTHLTARGQTLSAYPSIEGGTLGGWIASGSHGSGGPLWKQNFGQILVQDLQGSRGTFLAKPDELFPKTATIYSCRRWFIVEVEITAHENVLCKKVADKLLREAEYAEFIERPSYLRMLQIGQRGVMRLLWLPASEDDKEQIHHHDPHFFSREGLWLQSDILGFMQSADTKDKDWFAFPVEPKQNYTSLIRLADANAFTIEPSFLTTPIGLLWINFEVFVHSYKPTGVGLMGLSESLRSMFESVWGRCELRLGGDILFLDFNVSASTNIGGIFSLLQEHLGTYCITLHRGKAQVQVTSMHTCNLP